MKVQEFFLYGSDEKISLDVSDEACLRYGVKSGIKFRINKGAKATVKGVGIIKSNPEAGKQLFCVLDGDDGRVSYWGSWKDDKTKPFGFSIIE